MQEFTYKDFFMTIHVILVYWDPWSLTPGHATPKNEYDSHIEQVFNVCKESNGDINKVKDGINKIFNISEMPQMNIDRAVNGIVEGLSYGVIKYLKD